MSAMTALRHRYATALMVFLTCGLAEEFGSPHGRLTGQSFLSGPRRGYRVPHARATTGVGAPYTPRTAVLFPD